MAAKTGMLNTEEDIEWVGTTYECFEEHLAKLLEGNKCTGKLKKDKDKNSISWRGISKNEFMSLNDDF